MHQQIRKPFDNRAARVVRARGNWRLRVAFTVACGSRCARIPHIDIAFEKESRVIEQPRYVAAELHAFDNRRGRVFAGESRERDLALWDDLLNRCASAEQKEAGKARRDTSA